MKNGEARESFSLLESSIFRQKMVPVITQLVVVPKGIPSEMVEEMDN